MTIKLIKHSPTEWQAPVQPAVQFLGMPLVVTIETQPFPFKRTPPKPNRNEKKIAKSIVENVEQCMANTNEFLDSAPTFNLNLSSIKLTETPEIWISRELQESQGPERWTLVFETTDQPGGLWRVEFESLQPVEVWREADPTDPTPDNNTNLVECDHDFFKNRFFGRLEIELTKPAVRPDERFLNEVAQQRSTVQSVKLITWTNDADRSAGKTRDFSQEELQHVVINSSHISLTGEGGVPTKHQAPIGKNFRLCDLISAIEQTELETRGNSDWFDGIDVHHIYIDAIVQDAPGAFHILWGS